MPSSITQKSPEISFSVSSGSGLSEQTAIIPPCELPMQSLSISEASTPRTENPSSSPLWRRYDISFIFDSAFALSKRISSILRPFPEESTARIDTIPSIIFEPANFSFSFFIMLLKVQFVTALSYAVKRKCQFRAGYITFRTECSVGIAYHISERNNRFHVLHIGKIRIVYVGKTVDARAGGDGARQCAENVCSFFSCDVFQRQKICFSFLAEGPHKTESADGFHIGDKLVRRVAYIGNTRFGTEIFIGIYAEIFDEYRGKFGSCDGFFGEEKRLAVGRACA